MYSSINGFGFILLVFNFSWHTSSLCNKTSPLLSLHLSISLSLLLGKNFNKYWTDKQCKNIGRINKDAGKNKIKIEDCKAACKLKDNCNAVNFCSFGCIFRNCKEPIPPPMGKRSKCKGHIVKRGRCARFEK